MISGSRHDKSQRLGGHAVETLRGHTIRMSGQHHTASDEYLLKPKSGGRRRYVRCGECIDVRSEMRRQMRRLIRQAGMVMYRPGLWVYSFGIPSGSFLRFQTGSSFVGCLMSPLCGDVGASFGFHVSSAHSGTSFVGCLMSPLCKGQDGCTEEQYCLVTYTLFTIEN